MSRQTRLTQLALAAAAGYAVTGAVELAHDQPPVFADTLDWVIEAAFAIALAASIVVLVAIARTTRPRPAPATGWALAAIGTAALGAAALATTIAGRDTLDPLFPLGFLAIIAGYATLAVVDLRHRLTPPRAGLVLLTGFIATAITDNLVTGGGTLVLAATWAALARLISIPQDAPRSQRRPAVAA